MRAHSTDGLSTEFEHRLAAEALCMPFHVLGQHERAVPDACRGQHLVRRGRDLRVLAEIQRRAIDHESLAPPSCGVRGQRKQACFQRSRLASLSARTDGAEQTTCSAVLRRRTEVSPREERAWERKQHRRGALWHHGGGTRHVEPDEDNNASRHPDHGFAIGED